MGKQREEKKGLKLEHKLLIFFGGIFIVAFAGFKYFDSVPGLSKKEKNLSIVLYYLGVVFWIGGFTTLYYLIT
ncbi:hypothetical protein [Pontimicrobium sp. IMCC45349]|uniref:hypothetical protein n=1 Tax=Pontimicrobium sp. IMCC45349 TaxID=3391574 RepID=UPI0039A38BED